MQVTTHADALNLGLESTLGQLPSWEVDIELDHPGNDLAKLFEQEPLLPGIILTRNQHYMGMISRRSFFEKMSRPYSLGLFSERPIDYLYNLLQQQEFVLSEDTLIVKATQEALQRSPQFVYEPVIVKTKSGKHKVVDFYSLLLAYSQLHILTLNQLQQEKEKSEIAETGLRELQHNNALLVNQGKMAVLGQIVAEVAHDIKNPINLITGNLIHATRYIQALLHLLSLYQQRYPQPVAEIQTAIKQIDLDLVTTELPMLLTSIKGASKHIQRVVRYLYNLSSFDEAEKKEVDIHESIDSALLILQSRLKVQTNTESIKIVKEYGNIPLVKCYVGQLNLVFVNILSYAINSLKEEIKQKKLRVGKEPGLQGDHQASSPLIRIRTHMPAPTQLIIRIAAKGSGITQEVQHQIFDPSFTTKSIGKKPEIGLSMSYQIIVEKHGGQLYCISTPGQGTEFIINLPMGG